MWAYDLVIFDCDGVLVDSEYLASSVDQALLQAHKVHLPRAEVCSRYAGLSYGDMIESVNSEFGTTIVAEDFETQAKQNLEVLYRTELRPVAHMDALVRELPMQKCVASSSPPDKLKLSLELTRLHSVFDPYIFSTSLVANGKPAPDIIYLACEKTQTAPQNSVVIEDSPHGVRAALSAGADVIGFTAGTHCGPDSVEVLQAAGAEKIARSAAELRALLSAPLSVAQLKS